MLLFAAVGKQEIVTFIWNKKQSRSRAVALSASVFAVTWPPALLSFQKLPSQEQGWASGQSAVGHQAGEEQHMAPAVVLRLQAACFLTGGRVWLGDPTGWPGTLSLPRAPWVGGDARSHPQGSAPLCVCEVL